MCYAKPEKFKKLLIIEPSVYVSRLKLHSATKINLHRVSESALLRNHLKVRLSPLKSPALRNSRSKYRRSILHPSFLSAEQRGVAVANIYVVNQLSNLTLIVDNFL